MKETKTYKISKTLKVALAVALLVSITSGITGRSYIFEAIRPYILIGLGAVNLLDAADHKRAGQSKTAVLSVAIGLAAVGVGIWWIFVQ